MIVLDEQICREKLREEIGRWHKGKVECILEARPKTVIKDDVIPALLRRFKDPTFVTINYTDFWKRVPSKLPYCIICLRLPTERWREVAGILRLILRQKEFNTKKKRIGKVVSWSDGQVSYYQS